MARVKGVTGVFDPMSSGALMVLSLFVPFAGFLGLTVSLRQAQRFLGRSVDWSRGKAMLYSLLTGMLIALSYSVAVVIFWFLETIPFSVPEVGVKTIILAGSLSVGIYVGAELARWMATRSEASRH
jgi:hypothetical protein